MRLRTQPELEAIVAELATWQRWTAAYYRHEVPLPELPVPQGEPSNATMLCGFFVRSALRTVGWIGRRGRMFSSLRVWAARQQVRVDWMALEPASCALNDAFTELGLSLLDTGDTNGAIESLRAAWRVHPCPHNISFGLNPHLWVALGEIPEAEAVRSEYEYVARQFSSHFGPPRGGLSLKQTARALYNALLRKPTRHGDDEHKHADR